MAQAVAEIEIHAPVQKVFDAVTDFENYPEFLSESKAVTVQKRSKKGAVVTFEVSVIKTIHYTLDMKFNPPHHVSWTLVEGDFMKSNDGSWELVEIKKGHTKAIYRIEVGFGLLVPGSIAKALVSSNLPAMLKAFKKRIEA